MMVFLLGGEFDKLNRQNGVSFEDLIHIKRKSTA